MICLSECSGYQKKVFRLRIHPFHSTTRVHSFQRKQIHYYWCCHVIPDCAGNIFQYSCDTRVFSDGKLLETLFIVVEMAQSMHSTQYAFSPRRWVRLTTESAVVTEWNRESKSACGLVAWKFCSSRLRLRWSLFSGSFSVIEPCEGPSFMRRIICLQL